MEHSLLYDGRGLSEDDLLDLLACAADVEAVGGVLDADTLEVEVFNLVGGSSVHVADTCVEVGGESEFRCCGSSENVEAVDINLFIRSFRCLEIDRFCFKIDYIIRIDNALTF